jgi:hypothetical protein
MWSCGYASSRLIRTNKAQEIPCTPAKSYACKSTPLSLGSVFTAKSCKCGERVSDPLKGGPVS